MTKWEYYAFEFKANRIIDVAELNKLGNEGWELVCKGGNEQVGLPKYLLFKRPIE